MCPITSPVNSFVMSVRSFVRLFVHPLVMGFSQNLLISFFLSFLHEIRGL